MDPIEIAYQEALDYLYSFIDYSLTRAFRYSPEKFNLDRMRAMMKRLGNPHLDYYVLHIAGTKGKGSVSALLEKSLELAGYKVGLYTSPHLHDYCERITINGLPISHEDFVGLVDELKKHVPFVPEITTFELTTALAFLYFSRKKASVAVIEVGLGGRLDATNVVDPFVSVITSISYDHVNVLGDTLTKIASEKAGIIKKGKSVVVAPQREEARRVVERIATEREAMLFQVGRDLLYAPLTKSLSGQTMQLWNANEQGMIVDYIESGGREDWEPLRLTIPLLGYHQVENAATAFAALQMARKQGLSIPEASIVKGFSLVHWPGRFEVLREKPPFIVDSAHNQDSALKLRLAIDDYLPGQQVILIFGASEDKDIRGMFTVLLPRVKRVIATQSVHPRAVNPDEIVELAFQFGCQAQSIDPIEEAVERALEYAGKEAAVVVAGSIFVAAAVRDVWFSNHADFFDDNGAKRETISGNNKSRSMNESK